MFLKKDVLELAEAAEDVVTNADYFDARIRRLAQALKPFLDVSSGDGAVPQAEATSDGVPSAAAPSTAPSPVDAPKALYAGTTDAVSLPAASSPLASSTPPAPDGHAGGGASLTCSDDEESIEDTIKRNRLADFFEREGWR